MRIAKEKRVMIDNIIRNNRGNSFPIINKNVFDDVFKEFFENDNFFQGAKRTSTYPANIVKVKKNGKITHIRIEYALAGFSKDEINVSVKNGVLYIQAKEHDNGILEEGFEETIVSRGISYKSFSAAYQLMDDADKKAITSSFVDGLLVIVIPVKEDDESMAIEIK